jgi:hypothetical protein
MARYMAHTLMRFDNGRAIVPGLPFERVYRPEHEAALIAGGSISRLDDEAVIRTEWIAAGFIEPDPEPAATATEGQADPPSSPRRRRARSTDVTPSSQE